MEETRDLKQLAVDIYDGKVFTSNHVSEHDSHIIPQIFMPIIFGAFKDKHDNDISLVYEYLSEAGPRSINGYPIFTSLKFLNNNDFNEMNDYYTKYKELKESFIKS